MPIKFIHHRKLNWEKVDWKKSTSEIARLMGVPTSRVSLMRRKLAPQTLRQWNRARWKNVDWSKQNHVIAKELDVSRSLVAVTRKRRGERIPDVPEN